MARDGPSQGGVALSCAFGGEMVRPSATGLATAFFRLYLLESLVSGPARPAALLAAIAAERLPFASGAFGRALQSLIEGGYLAPASAATVCLTALGAAERTAERVRWSIARSARRWERQRLCSAATSPPTATASAA